MKNIILISIDNLRFDCIGYQPDRKELIKYDVLKYLETPMLDSIAEKSLFFTQCISTNTYTTAAHASILTGLYPPRHGVRAFYGTKLSPDVYTLAEILKIFGYETVMMTDTMNLFLPLELNRGFDHFFHINDRALLKFLDEDRDKKLFLFVHFYDVHEPFLLSKNPDYMSGEYIDTIKYLYRKFNLPLDVGMHKNFQYYRRLWLRLVGHIGYKSHDIFFPLYVKGVSRFDQGRFRDFVESIRFMGLLEDALTVIVADHGEGKSSPNNPDNFTHGGKLYDSVVRVPLMFHHQDVPRRLINDTVSIVDIFPTIIDLVTGEEAENLLGYSPDGVCLNTPDAGGERFVYSEHWGRDTRSRSVPHIFLSNYLDQRALRGSSRKFLISGEPECLDDQNKTCSMSNSKFVQNVYRGLLCRFEGFREHVDALKDLDERRITRDELVQKVFRSLEYRSRERFFTFDLQEDPYEERPVKREDRGGQIIGPQELFETIMSISRYPAETGDIFPDDRDAILTIVRKAFGDECKGMCDIFLDNKHILNCLIEEFLLYENIDALDRNKKRIGDMLLTSEKFGAFLRKRMTVAAPGSSVIKKVVTRYIPHYALDKTYFLLLKLFPRETLRGRVWHRFLERMLNS